MTRTELRNIVPTLAVHATAAGLHGAAASALGAQLEQGYMAGLAAVILGLPVAGLALVTAGRTRLGAGLLLLSFLGASALGLYTNLGLGLLEVALSAPPGFWARVLFFGTAMGMALLQVKGVLEAALLLFSSEAEA